MNLLMLLGIVGWQDFDTQSDTDIATISDFILKKFKYMQAQIDTLQAILDARNCPEEMSREQLDN